MKKESFLKRQFQAENTLKAPTGIPGLDQIAGGGLPRGRTTLIEGGPGSGKTVLAMQSLVNGARLFNEPGIFVAFEESLPRLNANAAKFGWDLPALQKKKLFFLDAQIRTEIVAAGNFDLGGMLAVLAAKADEIKAKRIVFDAIDVVLSIANNFKAEQKEIFRLHEWLLERELTSIITCKATEDGTIVQPFGFMQFMADCSVILKHSVVHSTSQRSLRLRKYRGSAFEENETPFLIDAQGLEVAESWLVNRTPGPFTTRRVSSGVKRLDAVLGGGYYQGSSILITGAPGTAKSTLGGAFAEACCARGERTLVVTFDTGSTQYVGNLASVNINLERFETNGVLHVASARTVVASAEINLMRIKKLVALHRAKCLVIDPASALSKIGNSLTAHCVAERLLDWTKSNGITLLCTSLIDSPQPETESTPLQISTLADTWIHLGYLVRSGERNRSLSVIKSRGSAHSNQVRELVLDSRGITLADAYTAGGEVLMGTLRWEKERAETIAAYERNALSAEKEANLLAEENELATKIGMLRREMKAKRVARSALSQAANKTKADDQFDLLRVRELRGSDKQTSKNK